MFRAQLVCALQEREVDYECGSDEIGIEAAEQFDRRRCRARLGNADTLAAVLIRDVAEAGVREQGGELANQVVGSGSAGLQLGWASGASRVCTAVLIEKHHDRRLPGVSADVVGLGVEDRYVFGFGMDYKGYLRNLNGIYALGPEQA